MSTERKTKQFWGCVGNEVQQVTGYDCAPANPGTWWLPDLGYSRHEDYIAETEADALTEAIEEAEKFERGIQTKLTALRAQRSKLESAR